MYLGALATVLGRDDEAERFFEEAAELNERGQMHFAEVPPEKAARSGPERRAGRDRNDPLYGGSEGPPRRE